MLALPYRRGGLGILDPSVTADIAYSASKRITAQVTDLIYNQNYDVSKIDTLTMNRIKKQIKTETDAKLQGDIQYILDNIDEKSRRLLKAAAEKGASSWLSVPPLKQYGYALNKQEFRDGICLRYGWKIVNIPNFCSCGKRNSIDHILVCKKGGYVSLRHNILRDTEAKLLSEICKDVKTEPGLIPVERDDIAGDTTNNSKLDISAIGLWGPCQKSMFDIRVTYPNADSFMSKDMEEIYKQNEDEKKRKYNDRVLKGERATFSPLVFSTSGGMGTECK